MSVTLMFLDQRGEWLAEARYVLQFAAYPIQLAVSSPSSAWRWVQESAQTRDVLRSENTKLRARQRELEIRTMRYDALARENAELRGLREALPPVAEKWLVAEVVNIEPNSLRQTLLVNRGTHHGVFQSQAVLDDRGLIGQTTHVGPWSAEVILITDPEHAVPVQIERTGLRTIAVGTGTGLALPYLPGNADVKTDDLLITSGLGGVFPQGYPVARITAVQREAVQPLAQVRAVPLAQLDRVREVMLVWFREEHPAAPGPTTNSDLKTGNPKMQPQPVPPKPPAAVAPAPATGESTTSATPPATNAPRSTTSAPASATARGGASKASATPSVSATGDIRATGPSNSRAAGSASTSTPTSNSSSPAAGASRATRVTPAPANVERAAPSQERAR
jgi:rod shape-determining protein MreC